MIKNTFLSNTDNASVSLRKLLLESCNLHTVLDLPGGTFTGAGVKTVVLFFEKGAPTRKVWFYQLNLDRNLGKTNPLNENDLAEFVELQKTKADSENSWSMNVADVDKTTFDLSVKNPHKKDETALCEPAEYGKKIIAHLSRDLTVIYGNGWSEKTLRHCLRIAEIFPSEEIVSALGRQLSWTHIKSLIYLEDQLKRDFYIELCRLEHWSVRQLQDRYLEKDLEDAILREIEQFLLELGAGFTFVERQKRLQIDNRDYYIDCNTLVL